MEATGQPTASYDLVTASFVVHECPPAAMRALIAEARRLLRPDGVLMLADNDPRCVSPCRIWKTAALLGQTASWKALMDQQAGKAQSAGSADEQL